MPILFVLVAWLPPAANADDQFLGIIENVRANEDLYQDIEIVLHKRYRLGQPKFSHDHFVKSHDGSSRVVFQKGLFYFRNEEFGTRLNGESFRGDKLQGFDGQFTRLIEDRAYANIHEGRWEDPKLLRPHTILLRRCGVTFPLSVYLAGSGAIKTHPSGASYARAFNLSVRLEKEEQIGGMSCLKIRSDVSSSQTPAAAGSIDFIWLAPDRNYLPILLEEYWPSINTDIPVAVGRAEDFREIASGVWLPFRTSFVMYDPQRLADNERVVSNSEEYIVDKAILDPEYDISLFRDIRFPKDIPVYVVKSGQIIRSYFHGEHGDVTASAPRRWLLWLVLAALAAVIVAVSLVVYYRVRRPTWPWLDRMRALALAHRSKH